MTPNDGLLALASEHTSNEAHAPNQGFALCSREVQHARTLKHGPGLGKGNDRNPNWTSPTLTSSHKEVILYLGLAR